MGDTSAEEIGVSQSTGTTGGQVTETPTASADPYSGAGLIEFLDAAIEKGWLNVSSAKAMRTATQKILEVEGGWQSLDLRSLDVDSLLSRFRNLRRNDYSDDSMRVYRQRFGQALKMHLARLENDGNWRSYGPQSSPRSSSGGGSRSGGRKGATATVPTPREAPSAESAEREDDTVSSASTTNPGGMSLMRFPFPLREAVDVYLALPRDLNTDEADRLAGFIRSLARPALADSQPEAN